MYFTQISKGSEVLALVPEFAFEDVNGVEYVFANIKNESLDIKEVLEKGLPDVIRNISNPRAMRWGGKNIRFLRPIRWIVSLLNDQILEFDLDGIKVGNTTKGHRVLGSSQILIDRIDDYERILEENYVILSEEKRRSNIVKGLFMMRIY